METKEALEQLKTFINIKIEDSIKGINNHKALNDIAGESYNKGKQDAFFEVLNEIENIIIKK